MRDAANIEPCLGRVRSSPAPERHSGSALFIELLRESEKAFNLSPKPSGHTWLASTDVESGDNGAATSRLSNDAVGSEAKVCAANPISQLIERGHSGS